MDDDFYDEDANEGDFDRNLLNNTHNKLYNDGYREKKLIMDEKYMQDGFNDGIKMSLTSGKLLGGIYAKYRNILNSFVDANTSNNNEKGNIFPLLVTKLDTLFMVTVPELMIELTTKPLNDKNANANAIGNDSSPSNNNFMNSCMQIVTNTVKRLLFEYNKLLTNYGIIVPTKILTQIESLSLSVE